jgi:SNF2 family DNA or RNA helicase
MVDTPVISSEIPGVNTALSTFDTWIDKAHLDSKPYQKEGLKWLLEKELTPTPIENIRGGIVADEMGLGKTIQMLGLIISHFVPKTLIVLPLPLLSQWKNEIYRLLGHKACVYHGPKRDLEQVKRAPIVITTYGQISIHRIGKNLIHLPDLLSIQWDRVIFDEGHKLRNRKNSTTIGARNLQARHKWIVTGTPIQNRKSDFYSICDVIGIPVTFSRNPENLLTIARNFILYRTKSDVKIQLPQLKLQTISVDWESQEELSIAENLHSMFSFTEVTPHNTNAIIKTLGRSVFSALLRARQSCILPALMNSKFQQLIEKNPFGDDEIEYGEIGLRSSSKINAIVRMIDERKDNGRPKIIFSHFTQEIDTLEMRLSGLGIAVGKIDGRSTSSHRESVVYNQDIHVLILQINSCSEGLNLQRYKEVYFVSPHWNPCVEDQAIARAHRIGQNACVDVFRFEMMGFAGGSITIEQYCRIVQEMKRQCARDVLSLTEFGSKHVSPRHPQILTSVEIDALGDKMCPICYSDFDSSAVSSHSSSHSSSLVVKTHCGHCYHKKCIKTWVTTRHQEVSIHKCPCCRETLNCDDLIAIKGT